MTTSVNTVDRCFSLPSFIVQKKMLRSTQTSSEHTGIFQLRGGGKNMELIYIHSVINKNKIEGTIRYTHPSRKRTSSTASVTGSRNRTILL